MAYKKIQGKSKIGPIEILLMVLIAAVVVLCIVLLVKIIKGAGGQGPTNEPSVSDTPTPGDETPSSGTPDDTDGTTPTPTPDGEISNPTATPTSAPSPTPTPGGNTGNPVVTPSPTPYTGEYELVAYNGRVEHLFTHSLIAFPDLAYGSLTIEQELKSTFFVDCITVSEFKQVLEALYKDNYMLINLNDVYECIRYDNNTKEYKLKKPIMFPKGKKPLILSFDDVNYYSKKMGNGFVDKLVLKDGKVQTYTKMKDGTVIYSDDNEHVPILEKFVAQHPDFSFNGAMGMLCVTGYEGVLGYRVQRLHSAVGDNRTAEERQAEIDAVTPLIAKLKENGWYFASHSYEHGSMTNYSEETMWDFANKFETEITPIIGKTRIYVFPYGAWQPSTEEGVVPPAQKVLLDFGFEYFCGVGIDWFAKVMNGSGSSKWYLGGIIFQDRASVDGQSMLRYREKFLKTSDGYDRFPSLDFAVIWDEEARRISYEDARSMF